MMQRLRPSAVVSMVLAVLFLIARPESVNAALSALGWLLTAPAGSVLLGGALLVSLVHCMRTSYTVHAYR
ncbi:hypothetical protein ACIRLA_22100 [Streptomyces sp. NPDC102364]|uniref:hypothetical protein n=1 Tax=Streptomyces sp. NPDC102364 TaxID=3366161 RepID=UPI003826CF33